MRAGCQVGTKADELLQGAPRVPPSEVLPLPDTPDTHGVADAFITIGDLGLVYLCM